MTNKNKPDPAVILSVLRKLRLFLIGSYKKKMGSKSGQLT